MIFQNRDTKIKTYGIPENDFCGVAGFFIYFC